MRPKALACAPRTPRRRRTDEHRRTAAAPAVSCRPEQSQTRSGTLGWHPPHRICPPSRVRTRTRPGRGDNGRDHHRATLPDPAERAAVPEPSSHAQASSLAWVKERDARAILRLKRHGACDDTILTTSFYGDPKPALLKQAQGIAHPRNSLNCLFKIMATRRFRQKGLYVPNNYLRGGRCVMSISACAAASSCSELASSTPCSFAQGRHLAAKPA